MKKVHRFAALGTWVAMLAGCAPPEAQVGDDEASLSDGASGNEVLGGWTTCSNGPKTNCGGKGGAGKIVKTQLDVDVSGGGRTGVAEEHTSAGVDYGTSYWYRETGHPTFLATSIDYTTDLFIPSANDKYQAIEWDTEQHLGGFLYNAGWQANKQSGQWRWFEYGGGSWHDSGIPYVPFSTNAWHRIHAHYSIEGTTITNDYLEVDGVRHTPTSSTAHARVASGGTKMNIGLQMDQDSAGDEMRIFWDNVNLTYHDGSSPPPPACSAPVVTEPFDGQSVGPAIQVTTTAPDCIVATKCYLSSSGGTVVASGDQTIDGVWVSVPVGADSVSCNGWDGSGKAYVGAHVGFTRPK